MEKNIQVFFPEPGFVEQVQYLEQKFKSEVIFGFFVLEAIDQFFRANKSLELLNIEIQEEILWEKEKLFLLPKWREFDFSENNFEQILKKTVNLDFEQLNPKIANTLIDPIKWDENQDWTIFNQISLDNDNFRNLFIAQQIKQKTQEHNKILVIYGGHHLYILQDFLQKIF